MLPPRKAVFMHLIFQDPYPFHIHVCSTSAVALNIKEMLDLATLAAISFL